MRPAHAPQGGAATGPTGGAGSWEANVENLEPRRRGLAGEAVHAMAGGLKDARATEAEADELEARLGRLLDDCLLYTSPSPRDRG